MVGTTIAQYRIESEAGAGGMGVVYLAVDVQLKRPVAIKVLNAAAMADPDRKRRFVQEAQAASALNHPDIVTIYQIGTDGQTDFIAMEFVAGRSLAEVIHGRPLPPADVVRYATRIAGALAAAHHAGIVHRDLKPGNVMVTEKQGIKLLDFGVAKLLEPTTSETAVTGPIAANTLTGLVIGTAAYMSPEQARGEKIDARSDIYAFGVVLHEMIAGQRPPNGVPALPASTPRDLGRIVARCLQPDPDRRFQIIDDVALALEEAELAAPRPPVAPVSRARGLAWIAVTLALAAAAGFAAWRLKPAPPVPPVRPARVLTRLTMDSGLTIDPVLSPDGRLIAFASDRGGNGGLDIWLRQVAGGDAVQLTTDPADDSEPSFSPDGSHLAFRSERSGGGVYVISTLGGSERRVADAGRRPRWSPDGKQIAYWTGLNAAFLVSKADAPRVFLVAAIGGAEPRRLFTDFAVAYMPIWSPDGKRLLFFGARDTIKDQDWFIANADGTAVLPTGAVAAAEPILTRVDGLYLPDAWMHDGRVLFSARQGDAVNIWAMPIGAGGRVSGAPERLTSGTGIEMGATIDLNDTLAFATLVNDVNLWSLPINPSTGRAAGAESRLTNDPAGDFYPELSPNGVSLAFLSNRSGAFDAWVRDLATGRDTLIAQRPRFPSRATFSNDSRRVIFHSQTRWRWLSLPIAGAASASPELVCDACESFWDLSNDGRWALFGMDGDTRILARNRATGKDVELMRFPDQIMGRFRISPDNRFAAFNVRQAGSIQIVVIPFDTTGPIAHERWITITPEDTLVNAATWSADGSRLYYLSNRDGGYCVWAQPLDRATGRPVGEAVGVWHFHEARRSMARISMGNRALTASRDRLVVSIAESSGNIWLAK